MLVLYAIKSRLSLSATPDGPSEHLRRRISLDIQSVLYNTSSGWLEMEGGPPTVLMNYTECSGEDDSEGQREWEQERKWRSEVRREEKKG